MKLIITLDASEIRAAINDYLHKNYADVCKDKELVITFPEDVVPEATVSLRPLDRAPYRDPRDVSYARPEKA